MNDNILNKLREKAAQLYPDDKNKAEDFVNGFTTKIAMATEKGGFFQMSAVGKGLGEQLGRLGATSAVGVGIAGVAALVNAVKNHAKYNNFLKALNEAVQMNRVLKGADKEKVINFAHTIFKFAPSVATDPNMLSSILANAVHGDGIDPMTIRTLTELESRYRDTTGFTPKQWM